MNVQNKKALFDYEVIESLEAGIELTGSEVKSIRAGGANFAGARVLLESDGAYLIGLNIQKYQFSMPLKLYNKASLIKVQIALVRGKKKFEKRELIKKKASNLALARRLKNQ
ncbi:MAG: hypothetical protein UW84_C0016G0021 [Candidatus Collierbacteria bacterium GW2011_GWA2_44_99]|uniref:SsrA-binding protein n=1 Tax=Candidatus Collierbacteria bacterium GW2011_GWA2_44_99 TaxID=1618380 RepID=A0A0G1MZD2_9BACT|nr:MAG: hypothetical protein UW84_C0016G0021 [Candidatus Collierbacteria bacterium GW2011_GWA2_44_99]